MSLVCLLCGKGGEAQPVSPKVRDGEPGKPAVVRCANCGHVQLHPIPTLEEERAFYRGDMQARSLFGPVELEARRAKDAADTERRVAWLRRLEPRPQGESLDVGCGYGFYVDALAREGYRASGIDWSTERHRLALSDNAGTFIDGEVTEAFAARERHRFRVVTLFHVLEHVRDPLAFLERCHRLVAPGGIMLVEVPNEADELMEALPAYRAFHWQRAHLSYFNPERLAGALRQATGRAARLFGVQRYGVRNLLRWVDSGAPTLQAAAEQENPLVDRLDRVYRAERERDLKCDTLAAEIRC